MESKTIDDKIRLKQLEIQIEQDPSKKAELNAQLQKLQLQRELDKIKQRMKNMSS